MNIAFQMRGITDFFKGYCADSGIRVTISERTKVPCCRADGNIYLPPPTVVGAARFWGGAFHEASHLDPDIRWTMDFLKEIKSKKEHTVYNILIDHLCERNRHGYYKGRDEAIYDSNVEILSSKPDMLMKVGAAMPVIAALVSVDLKDRAEWQGVHPVLEIPPDAQPYAEAIEAMSLGKQLGEILDTKDKPRLRALAQAIIALEPTPPPQPDEEPEDGDGQDSSDDGESDTSETGEGNSSEETSEPEGQPDEGDQDAEEGGEADGDGGVDNENPEHSDEDEGDGSSEEVGEESDPGDGVGDEEADEGEASGEDGAPDDGDTEAGSPGDAPGDSDGDADDSGEPSDGDAEAGDSDSDGSAQPGDSGGDDGQSGDSEGDKADGSEGEDSKAEDGDGGGWGQCTTDEEIESAAKELGDWLNDNPCIERGDPPRGTWANAQYIPQAEVNWTDRTQTDEPEGRDADAIRNAMANSFISREIQRYLKVLTTTRYTHGMKRGKLSGKAIHRVFGGGQGQPRIFKQKQACAINNDTALTLLIDQSGSMRSLNKYIIAAACGVLLSDTLRDIRVPCELLCFTDDRRAVSMYHIKRFDEMNLLEDRLISRLSQPRKMDCNADGESLMIAAERLMQQTQENKVLIVLSDGRPVGYGMGSSSWYLSEVTRLIEEESPIKLFGIGIRSNEVKRYYTNNCVVSDPGELDAALLPIMRDAVLVPR